MASKKLIKTEVYTVIEFPIAKQSRRPFDETIERLLKDGYVFQGNAFSTRQNGFAQVMIRKTYE